jgi:hypothetical protein
MFIISNMDHFPMSTLPTSPQDLRKNMTHKLGEWLKWQRTFLATMEKEKMESIHLICKPKENNFNQTFPEVLTSRITGNLGQDYKQRFPFLST